MSETPHTTLIGERGRGRALVEVNVGEAAITCRLVHDVEVRDAEGRLRVAEETREWMEPRPAGLLRINMAALGSYHEGRDGGAELMGSAHVIARGIFAAGAAGRCGSADDLLIGFRAGEPGAVVALTWGHMRALTWAWDGEAVRECTSLADVPEEARPALAIAVSRLYRRGMTPVTGWHVVGPDGVREAVTAHSPLHQEREWARSGHTFWGVALRLEDGTLRFLEGDEALQDANGVEVALGAGAHRWCGWVPGTRATWVETGVDGPASADWWVEYFARQEAEAAEAAAREARRLEAGAPADAEEVVGHHYPGTTRASAEDWHRPVLPIALSAGPGGEHVLTVDVRPAPGVDPAAGPWIGGIEVEWPAGWTGRVLGLELTRGHRRWYGLGLRALVWRTGDAAGTVTGPAEAEEEEELGWVLPDPPEPTPVPAVPAENAAAALAAAWGARARTGR